MSASLKAGLIGAAVAVLVSLLGVIPCLGCVASLLSLVLYVVVGILAAAWVKPRRDPGKAAGAGAVAGVITALGGGITSVLVTVIRYGFGRGHIGMMRQLRQLPPEVLEMWRDLGLDPTTMASPPWAIGSSAVCCGLGVLLGAALGAAAGAITASLQGDREATV